MEKSNEFETVIIGGGQAGLSVSYRLNLEGRDHIVLEQAAEAANAWRKHRWDSFTLNTLNWQSQLQGAGIPGGDPDGFLNRDELVSYFEKYIQQNRLPIATGGRVLTVKATGDHYTVETTAGMLHAKNVVVASGLYQKPRFPQFNGTLSSHILQLHSDGCGVRGGGRRRWHCHYSWQPVRHGRQGGKPLLPLSQSSVRPSDMTES